MDRRLFQCNVCKRIRPVEFPCNDHVCDGHDYSSNWAQDMRLFGLIVFIAIFTSVASFLVVYLKE